jgi:DNA-binding IclR family transcriptional regulator
MEYWEVTAKGIEALGGLGTKDAQYANESAEVLLFLYKREASTIEDMASGLAMEESTLRLLLKMLKEKKWISQHKTTKCVF